MPWDDDSYIRNVLDGREKWGTVLSVTAAAALLVFLADHPHAAWVDFGPLLVGAMGSFYVLVVNSYHKQAEAIAEARSKGRANEADTLKKKCSLTFVLRIRLLGRINIFAPVLVGLLATCVLRFGLTCACS